MDEEKRIALNYSDNNALPALMKFQNVSTSARSTIHNAVLVPTLLYSSETWILQNKRQARQREPSVKTLRSPLT